MFKNAQAEFLIYLFYMQFKHTPIEPSYLFMLDNYYTNESSPWWLNAVTEEDPPIVFDGKDDNVAGDSVF